ncbi:uncharacterized protein METZ01_LOCUS404767 [marine metagenome]|uniref:Uncharacterized protein n=1 Tax=marine metagenome TaxID=408172 RepID=A0A382VZI0_9ZZZZ
MGNSALLIKYFIMNAQTIKSLLPNKMFW